MKKPSLDLITQAKSLMSTGQTPVAFEDDPNGFVRRFVAGALAKLSKDEARGVAILAEWAERGVRNFELEAPVREAFAALPDVVKRDASRLPEVLAEVERWKMHHGQLVQENARLRRKLIGKLDAEHYPVATSLAEPGDVAIIVGEVAAKAHNGPQLIAVKLGEETMHVHFDRVVVARKR